MKENELMIGDWVYLVKDYGPIKKEVIKLDGLDLYRVFDEVLGVEPIPLTAEILKKMGLSIISPKKAAIALITLKETWVTSLIRQNMVICLV